MKKYFLRYCGLRHMWVTCKNQIATSDYTKIIFTYNTINEYICYRPTNRTE